VSDIRVVTWNAEGMFGEGTKTKRASPVDALSVLKNLNADIVVIPEFGNSTAILPETINAIESLSYECVVIDYNDERAPGLQFVVLSKLPIIRHQTFELEGTTRQALSMACRLPDGQILNIFGIHLDDRNEQIRMLQIKSVVQQVSNMTAPIIVAGDFNAMSEHSLFARLVRSTGARRGKNVIPHKQLQSVIERVSEMAIGTTIEYLLDNTTLVDLDPSSQPTISAKQTDLEWMPSWRLGKIDWMFGDSSIIVHSYKISKDVGSDHRAVIADITIT
jgi:endonuclease/exonuclease/phosphatase family metal-dependent hydrolase